MENNCFGDVSIPLSTKLLHLPFYVYVYAIHAQYYTQNMFGKLYLKNKIITAYCIQGTQIILRNAPHVSLFMINECIV